MKNKNQLYIIAIIILMIASTFTSCKKYEEGPLLSLQTKKARVINKWKIDKAISLDNGSDITSDYSDEIWEFTDSNDYTENNILKGTWQLSDNKTVLSITKINGDVKLYNILKLEENEMWLRKIGCEELYLSKY
jgi:hypothetical protein